ncbi:MAG: hypothetical protein D6780_05650 [Candidatus Dadabacteria bacterium]|nr:MAG: hypothetical protein D6780_05650 [Candidatus Dadabacteria bacterium]
MIFFCALFLQAKAFANSLSATFDVAPISKKHLCVHIANKKINRVKLRKKDRVVPVGRVISKFKKSIRKLSKVQKELKGAGNRKRLSKIKKKRAKIKEFLSRAKQCRKNVLPLERFTSSGNASIKVPLSALPEEVNPSDIRIEESINSADTTAFSFEETVPQIQQADSPFNRVFELLPDGLSLLSPAVISYKVPLHPDLEDVEVVNQAFHISNEAIDPASGTFIADPSLESVPLSLEKIVGPSNSAEMVLSTSVDHFSKLSAQSKHLNKTTATSNKVITINMETESGRRVFKIGERFTVKAVYFLTPETVINKYVEEIKDIFNLIPKPIAIKTTVVSPQLPWRIRGRFLARGEKILDKGVVLNVPPTTLVSTRTFTVRQQFKCRHAGKAVIFYYGFVRLQPRLIKTVVKQDEDGNIIEGEPREVIDAASWVSVSLPLNIECVKKIKKSTDDNGTDLGDRGNDNTVGNDDNNPGNNDGGVDSSGRKICGEKVVSILCSDNIVGADVQTNYVFVLIDRDKIPTGEFEFLDVSTKQREDQLCPGSILEEISHRNQAPSGFFDNLDIPSDKTPFLVRVNIVGASPLVVNTILRVFCR